MKIDDLQNSTNEDFNESKSVESEENATENSVDSAKKESDPIAEPKTESAAEKLLKKVQALKSEKVNAGDNDEDKDKPVKEEEVTEKVVEESVNQIDEDAKDSEVKEANEVEKAPVEVEVDYSVLSEEELVLELEKLSKYEDAYSIRGKVETIRTNFFKKHNERIKALKDAFIEKEGEEAEFKVEPCPLEEKFKAYYNVYKENRSKQQEKIEEEKKANLVLKYEIVDKIGELTTGQESLNKTFNEFKDLQKQWQEIGLVPQPDVKKLWESYHYNVEKFYDYVKINKDLRDLDLKKNLEIKTDLCVSAEELIGEPNVLTAFGELQKLHERWREIGPVATEHKESLWERFKLATSQINKKHQDYFDTLKLEQVNNLKGKTLLCEKVEEINTLELKTHREWDENSKEIIELQRLWKLIGPVPKKDNNRIYEQFRKACDIFFDAKREFYAKNKELEEENLKIKLELCEKAEEMMDSTDWRTTTDFYINLQKEWKTIGQVPRKNKDEVWKRFRKACNTYFDKKSEHFSSKDKDEALNLEAKKELIEKVKAYTLEKDRQTNFDNISEFKKQWAEIGYVPIKKKDSINKDFKEAINAIYSKLELGEDEISKLSFQSKLENLQNSSQSYGKIRNEREKIQSKLEQLQSDIVLWENNIGFFAKSKTSESMILKFEAQIDKAKKSVEDLKRQLRMINDLDVE